MPTTTTTKLQDFLGRWLTNATPGTSQATDHLGRKVVAGDKDFLNRNLAFANPGGWVTAHAYTVGQTIRSTVGGAILQVTVAGTSGATEPTAPASKGGQASDGTTLKWVRLH
jgi:hypothetical protein